MSIEPYRFANGETYGEDPGRRGRLSRASGRACAPGWRPGNGQPTRSGLTGRRRACACVFARTAIASSLR